MKSKTLRLVQITSMLMLSLILTPVYPAVADSSAAQLPTIEKIYMANAHEGWLLTQTQLWRTTDGGAMWQQTLHWPEGAYFPVAQFWGTHEAIVATNEESITTKRSLHVYVTRNGGTTWTIQSLGHPSSPALGVIDAIDIVSANTTWVLTGQSTRRGLNEPVALYRTSNGGHTWPMVIQVTYRDRAVGGLPLAGIKTDVVFTNSLSGWLVGVDKGEKVWLYHTKNGGMSWEDARIRALPSAYRHNSDGSILPRIPVFASAHSGILPVFFANAGSGLCVYSTNNGGKTWSLGKLIKGGEGLAIDPYNAQTIYVQSGHTLYLSQTKGISWSVISQDAPLAPAYLTFVTSHTGFLVDWTNHLWRTTDGGVHWESVLMKYK